MWSWALYDWANSSYSAIVATFVFPAYFAGAIVGDTVKGTVLMGQATSLAALLIAVAAPFLGAKADHFHNRKIFLAGSSIIAIAGVIMMALLPPESSSIAYAFILIILTYAGFELGIVFYNALLPSVSAPSHYGRASGLAFGLGYLGGLCILILCLALFPHGSNGVPNMLIASALWFAAFAVPLFLYVPEPKREKDAAALGGYNFLHSWRLIKNTPGMLRFLIAHMLFMDGLSTLFTFGGMYAAGSFGFNTGELLALGITLNIMAGIGAVVFAKVDDRKGSLFVLQTGLIAVAVCAGLLFVASGKYQFWAVTMIMSLFFGPLQSSARTYIARQAPVERRTELFGALALSGRATSFLGPALVAVLAALTGEQRWILPPIIGFFVVAYGLLTSVPQASKDRP